MAASTGLSRATFAKLSPHPYLLASLDSTDDAPPKRSDGRAPDQGRPLAINTESLSHANGSSLVRMGDTTVICGVRAETILTSNIPNFRASNTETELQDYDLLVPNIELATGCAPQFLPGGAPTTLAQTLSTRLYSLLHSSKLVQPEDLRIWDTQPSENPDLGAKDDEMDNDDQQAESGLKIVIGYWVLYIDIFFISFDGNPFDAAWAATLGALRDTKIPQARFNSDRELIVCSRNDPKPMQITTTPVACTAVVFTGKETDRPVEGKTWMLVDPDRLEESMCDEAITVVIDYTRGSADILSVSKHGGTVLSPELLTSNFFQSWTSERWKNLVAQLEGK